MKITFIIFLSIIVLPAGCGSLKEEGKVVILVDDSGNRFVSDPETLVLALEAVEEPADVAYLDRQKEAADPEIPIRKLEELAQDNYSQVRGAVAANPGISWKLLRKLSRDRDYKVRRAVAGNINTAPSVLARLSKDYSFTVRGAAAANPNTPEKSLITLLKDRHSFVRSRLTRNLRLSFELQIILAVDITSWSASDHPEFDHVCQGLLLNKNIDPQTREIVHMSDDLREDLRLYRKKKLAYKTKVEAGEKMVSYSQRERSVRAQLASKNRLADKKKQVRNRLIETMKLVSSTYPDLPVLREFTDTKYVDHYYKIMKEGFRSEFEHEGFNSPVYKGEDKKYYK